MATKLVNWTSKDGQIIKSGLSEGHGAKSLPSVLWFAYDCHGIESYLGNVGLNLCRPPLSHMGHRQSAISVLPD